MFRIIYFRSVLLKRVLSPLQFIEMKEGRIATSVLLRVVRNGSETAERPNNSPMTTPGVEEELENEEDLRFERPG